MPEVFEHERSGLLVPPGDPTALAAAMRRLWENPELCSQLGRAARESALRRFTPDIFYDRLMGVFERAIRFRLEAPSASDESLPQNCQSVV
jgi:glycosyltransferase involved in cell wall biosynthesis